MEKNKFILSVIVPCYNCEQYVERCVDSIIANSPSNTEVILINDGSKDGTLDKLNILKQKYSNLQVLNKKNSGVSDTRNYGIDVANGKYIAFVDSDDYIVNNMFNNMIEKIEYEKSDIICCDYYEKNEIHIIKSKFNYIEKKYNNIEFIAEFLKGKISISIWDKVFSKDILNNIRFNKKLAIGEDSLFCLESFLQANTIYLMNNSYYVYCQNDNSAVHTVSKKILQISDLDLYIPDCIKNDFTDEYNYFIADCMLRCIHTISNMVCKKNKTQIIDYIRKIYDINKINLLIRSNETPLYAKIELIVLKIMGVKFHLFAYKYYKLFRKVKRRTWKR